MFNKIAVVTETVYCDVTLLNQDDINIVFFVFFKYIENFIYLQFTFQTNGRDFTKRL